MSTHHIGIDIGGTRIKSVLCQGTTVLHRRIEPTPRLTPDSESQTGPEVSQTSLVTSLVARLVAELDQAAGSAAAGVGVAVPGLVDEQNGIAIWSANLGWRDLNLREALSEHLQCPVAIGHDVRTGLLGEHLAGAAREVDDVLFVPLGTGLAAALLVGGRIARGHAWTGEIGHVTVTQDGDPCGCGRRGCLESVIGAPALVARWHATGGADGITGLVAAVRADDHRASEIWTGAIEALAGVLAPVILAAGTTRVVIGGGLSETGATLLDPLREDLGRRLPVPVEVVPADLGEWAGAIGAAQLIDHQQFTARR